MYRILPVSLTFFILGLVIILHALGSKNKKKSVKFDEILLGIFHVLAAFVYPVMYSNYPSMINTLYTITNVFLGLTLLTLLIMILKEKVSVKYNPSIKTQRSYDNFKQNFLKTHAKKNKYKRRLTHIIPAAVILPIYLIAKSMAPWLPNWEAWSVCLIVTIGLSFVLFFSIGDLVRVAKPHLMPDWASKLFAGGLNEEEVNNNTFTTTSAMVLAFAPWILAGFLIFTIVTLVASVSDAMAAITGFRFGKRNFPKNSKKTVEGYIAGILTTFGLVILMFFILSTINPLYILAIGALAALVFFIVDLIDLPIDDNKINPHAIGLLLVFLIAAI